MNADIKFNNSSVQTLYNIAHSKTVANLQNTEDIKNVLLPLINDVINDTEAYLEARTKWNAFSSVVDHVEKQEKTYVRMDYDSSISFSLYMYIYH
jgi:hypothetical protein